MAYVPHDVSTEKFGNLIGQIQATNYVTFTDDEIDPEGTGHVKALHISLKCKDCSVAKVLIDNGSALNVLPKATLSQLPLDPSQVHPSNPIVRAFDGTKKNGIGVIDLPLEIVPYTFQVTMQVMDIALARLIVCCKEGLGFTQLVLSRLLCTKE